jgi:hypothetical protein
MLDKDEKKTAISELIMFLIAAGSCNYFKGCWYLFKYFFPSNPSLGFKNDPHLLAKIAQSDGN